MPAGALESRQEGARTRSAFASSGAHTHWAVLPSEVKATILRFEAQIRLEAGEVDEAKMFSSQAAGLNPAANKRLEALLLRSENKHAEAIKLLEGSDDPETIALYSAFLLEDGEKNRHWSSWSMPPVCPNTIACGRSSLWSKEICYKLAWRSRKPWNRPGPGRQ